MYFRNLLVATPSVETTKSYIDILLSFEIFLIHRVKFPYFVILSAPVLGFYGSRKMMYQLPITSAVLFSLSMTILLGLLNTSVVSVMIELFQHNSCQLILALVVAYVYLDGRVLLSGSLYFMAVCW